MIRNVALPLSLVGWGWIWYAWTKIAREGDGSEFVFFLIAVSVIIAPIATLIPVGKGKYITFAAALLSMGFLSFLAWMGLTPWKMSL
jgi:hypothetical protein